jgi:hypothetical protein
MDGIFDHFAKRVTQTGVAPACTSASEHEVHPDALRADLLIEPDPARIELLAPLGFLGRICSDTLHHRVLPRHARPLPHRAVRHQDPRLPSPAPEREQEASARARCATRREPPSAGPVDHHVGVAGACARRLRVRARAAHGARRLPRAPGARDPPRRRERAAGDARHPARAPGRRQGRGPGAGEGGGARAASRRARASPRGADHGRTVAGACSQASPAFEGCGGVSSHVSARGRRVRPDDRASRGAGARAGARAGLLDVYEARFGPVPKGVAAAVSATHDPDVLRGWLRLVATGSAAEVAAALRPPAPRRRAKAPARALRG